MQYHSTCTFPVLLFIIRKGDFLMMEPYKNAWGHICTQSAKAACSALIPVDLIRVSALTKITGDMCSRITECYGYEQLKGLTRFCGIAAGAALGVHLANKILSKIPSIGMLAASAATTVLHLTTGVILICACELLRSGQISDEMLQDSAQSSKLVQILRGNIGDCILRLIRGLNPLENAYAFPIDGQASTATPAI